MALVPALLVGWSLSAHFPWIAAASVLVLAIASYVDDRQGLPVALRLAMHIAVAIAFVLDGGNDMPLIVMIVLVLTITWSINLYNFMDGADGLAGGMALFGFGAFAVAAWLQGETEFSLLNVCVASAALGFLVFNFPPARTFLGDAGSVPLGYLAAVFGFVGVSKMLWPWWFPFLVFSPFAVDATITLALRVLRGERIWEAHREHFYQRLIRSGWGHRRTALAEFVLMAATGISSIWAGASSANVQVGTIVVWAAAYLVLMFLVDWRWRAFKAKNGLGS